MSDDDINQCPMCGALPCDWVNDPYSPNSCFLNEIKKDVQDYFKIPPDTPLDTWMRGVINYLASTGRIYGGRDD